MAALPFVWYFVSLTAVATVLGLILHFAPNAARRVSAKVLLIPSRIFVPATAVAIFFFTNDLSYTDAGIAFCGYVCARHSVHLAERHGRLLRPGTHLPIASILSFIMDSDHGPWFPSFFFVSVLVVNLISAYVFIPRLQKTIAGSAPATDEQPEQVQSTLAIPWAKGSSSPTRSQDRVVAGN